MTLRPVPRPASLLLHWNAPAASLWLQFDFDFEFASTLALHLPGTCLALPCLGRFFYFVQHPRISVALNPEEVLGNIVLKVSA